MDDVLVIGVGNVFRRDDGVGPAVAQRLRKMALPGVRVLERSGEGTSLMTAWEGAADVFLVDAAWSAASPGTIHRLNPVEEPIPAQFFNSFSSHAFGVAEAIEMARLMEQMPPRMVVFGIEGRSFENGLDLSPEVEQAADEVVDSILKEIDACKFQV